MQGTVCKENNEYGPVKTNPSRLAVIQGIAFCPYTKC